MNDAFAALQRIKASKVRAVAGVLPSTALVPSAPAAPRSVANTLPPARVPSPRPAQPSSTIDATSAIARRRESSKEVITEARRISSLPTWDYAEMLERCKPGGDLDLTPQFCTPAGTMGLKPVQNLALHWAKQQRGLIAPLAVGAGKTLLSLLVAPALGAQRPVLLVPPTMQIPLRREMERLAIHFKIPKNIFILPYSQLSIPKSSHLLEEIKPDLIIADEAHMLKNPDSARVRRFLRLFRNFPNTRLVAMSGTFTSKSLKDYGHLCELALRDGSPLPIEEAELLAWSNVLDSGSQPQERDWSIFAAFSDLRHIDDHTRRKDEARVVFRERFNATPGVVATREASVACSLNFFERELHPPDEVATALRDLHRTWTRPDLRAGHGSAARRQQGRHGALRARSRYGPQPPASPPREPHPLLPLVGEDDGAVGGAHTPSGAARGRGQRVLLRAHHRRERGGSTGPRGRPVHRDHAGISPETCVRRVGVGKLRRGVDTCRPLW